MLKNWIKHGLTQKEIEEAFLGFKLAFPDEKHSGKESRFCLIGTTNSSKTFFVAYTLRSAKVRIVSARLASAFERDLYDQTYKKYSKKA